MPSRCKRAKARVAERQTKRDQREKDVILNDQQYTLTTRGRCRQRAAEKDRASGNVSLSADDRESFSLVRSSGGDPVLAMARTFVPGLVEHYLARPAVPMKTVLAVLFVDIADSTSTVLRQPPEVALTMVQRFMAIVTDIALAHCGDVKDYEGDGALLYFGSVVEAGRAALAIRAALDAEQRTAGVLLQARMSLNVGEIIMGVIGSPQRRSVALIGPAVSLASRLLKHVPPGGIIAPHTAIVRLHQEAPDLAQLFRLWGKCLVPKGFEEECVTAYAITTGIRLTEDHLPSCNKNFPSHDSMHAPLLSRPAAH